MVIRFQQESRPLGISWQPFVLLTRIDFPKQHVCRTEEVLDQREPEPEPPHQEIGPEEPQLPPDCDAFMKPLSDEECELEPDADQNLPAAQDGLNSDPHRINEHLDQNLQRTKDKQKRLPTKSNKPQRKARRKGNVICCHKCGKRYVYIKSLVTHMSTHFMKLDSCKTCGKNFSSAKALRIHMAEHSLHRASM
ncbi:zinc finger protein 646-like [Poeciliopsis prolifica]|uniref:zinc finger protein 646-like n=1 Tax=Poeciliopsis prolifica TaxID=188132 RepID=UPI00241415D6|nr:zinc finger protein 646-like [Poeciliopsis prolifica]